MRRRADRSSGVGKNAIGLFGVLVLLARLGEGAEVASANLALAALGGRAHSWEPGVVTILEHEPAKANDGSLHSYWAVRPEQLPADLGVEWAQLQKVSSLVVRYFDGKMVRGPAVSRTQQWARLQYWDQEEWKDLEAQLLGQETSVVRYVFSPVTTSRIRLLFTEPPDPELRRSPERLGIFVCELEAYSNVPFQWVSSSDRLVRVQRHGARNYQRYYNEPPSGDADYDFAGPLILEPKQTRVFSDTLTPTLIVAESRWAQEPCITAAQTHGWHVRNGFLQLEVSAAGGFKETRLTNRVTSESVDTPRSKTFFIRTADGNLGPEAFKLGKVDTSGSDQEAAHLAVQLTSDRVDVVVHYQMRRQDHFYHKWLSLTNKGSSNFQVLDVAVSSLGLPEPLDLMAGMELTYPVTRLAKGGFFSNLETIYWEHQGDRLLYFPGVSIPPGKSLETEKAAIGVYKNRGEHWAGWDRGVREWISEYHAQISPLPKAWPDVYCEGWSAKIGVKELLERPQWSEKFMATAEKLGIRYMDAYEPAHQTLVMTPEWVRRFVDLANRYNIGTGWWIDFGSDIDWGTGAPLKPMACLLSPEAEQYLQKVVELARTYKLRAMHWADFFSIFPCNQTGHGHLPGKPSIYAQGQRMLRFGRELREASPGIMLGADGGFTNPQYVRYEDSRAHGTFYGGYSGDHFSAVEPDIHLDRLYAQMNRAYIFGSQSIYLRPWFRTLNCVNHFGQESHLHDRAGFRYSLLSAIAMAAQVTFNGVPENIPESEIQFAQRWLSWARSNKDYLKEGDRLFDRSLHFADVWQGDADSLSGFSHIRGKEGYVFLLNPTPIEQIAELTLAVDAPPSQHFVVEEIMPGKLTLQGPADGEYVQGGKVRATVPAKQVRILRIAPASAGATKSTPQAENARAAQWRRYVGDWTITEHTPESATLTSQFEFPTNGEAYLSNSVSESAWAKDPWAYDKAYLVFLLKDETEDLHNNWIPDKLPILHNGATQTEFPRVLVNGVSKAIHPFKTGRNQQEGLTRCYFVELSGETQLGRGNQVSISLPIRTGLVFSGAYMDVPDQMPSGE
jgi:hypothetical protein